MWKLYKKGGIDKMIDYPSKGKPCALNEGQQAWLTGELRKDTTQSLAQACKLVKAHTGVAYCVSAMHYVFKALGIKKKTGRPSHVAKDEQKVVAFKKKTFRH